MAKKVTSTKKIFVLDTSVILHDNKCINNFQEHDVAIPITVLEELDNFKKGNDTRYDNDPLGSRINTRFMGRIQWCKTIFLQRTPGLYSII